MNRHEKNSPPIRSISLTGFLGILLGMACTLADAKLASTLDQYFQGSHYLLFGVGVLLMFLGARQMLQGIFPSARKHNQSLLSTQRVSLPREGLVYLLIMVVLFVGSMLGRSNLLLLVFAMMAGPFILNGWMTFSMLKNSLARRKLPRRVLAGEFTSIEIELLNHKRFQASWLMAVQDQIRNSREQLNPMVMFTRVPPRESRVSYYRVRLMQRGRYQFGPLELSTRFPLGMVERGLTIRSEDELLVHPRIGRLTPRWKRDHLAASEIITRQQMRRGIYDDDVNSIREYRGGDNPRAIHWRTSARKNELMVREYQQSRNYDLAVYLDLWTPPDPEQADFERVELAVSFCSTVCVEFLRQSRDAHLHLMAAGTELSAWSGDASGMAIEPVLDILALIEADPRPDMERMLEDGMGQNHTRTRCLWITTRAPHKKVSRVEKINLHDFGILDERLSHFDVIEADPVWLSSFFSWE
ncbi:MAG: DUF58 domain-containing protein [Planctomycetaceae bacterium]